MKRSIAWFVFIAAASCSRSAPDDSGHSTAPALGSGASISSASGSSLPIASATPLTPPPTPPPPQPVTIADMFDRETKARLPPAAGHLRVEDAFAAFKKAGIAFVEEQQHLAKPYGAVYCVGAKVAETDSA